MARLIRRTLTTSGALGGLQIQKTTRRYPDTLMVRQKQPLAPDPSAAQETIRARFAIASEMLFTLGNAPEFDAFRDVEAGMTGRNVLQRWVAGWIRDGGPHTPNTFRGQNRRFPHCQTATTGGGSGRAIRIQGDWGQDVSAMYPITIYAFTCDARNVGPGERFAGIGSVGQDSQAWTIDVDPGYYCPWQNCAWTALGWFEGRAVYSHAQWVERGTAP